MVWETTVVGPLVDACGCMDHELIPKPPRTVGHTEGDVAVPRYISFNYRFKSHLKSCEF